MFATSYSKQMNRNQAAQSWLKSSSMFDFEESNHKRYDDNGVYAGSRTF